MLGKLISKISGGKPRQNERGEVLLNAYSTLGELPPMPFPHALLGQRDLTDPELRPHLDGFVNYVLSRGDGQMTWVRYHLMRHLQRVRQHLSLRVATDDLPAFRDWAQRANAVVFMEDGSVRDPQGKVLVDQAGRHDGQARPPWPDDAMQRKARTQAALSARGIAVSEGLPPVVGEGEVQLRPANEVAGRALALLVVALRAESIQAGEPMSAAMLRERLSAAFPYLTPAENAFLEDASPAEALVMAMGWRYESLELLAWSLGLITELSYPDHICDVPHLAGLFLDIATPEWIQTARLRPASDILDALDLHYRLHWLTREVELGRRELPGSLQPGVVPERHYALNWLTQFEYAAWDDVDTPT